MSRVGKQPVKVPGNVTVAIDGSKIVVKGPLGQLERQMPSGIKVSNDDGVLKVERSDDSRVQRGKHGLSRTLICNMIIGVTQGYRKELSIEGTGFKAQVQGSKVILSLGFASPKEYLIPEGIKVSEKQGVQLTVEGLSKELVGQAAARIRSYYPAEPYKGKGIKYVGEQIRRKQGKTVA